MGGENRQDDGVRDLFDRRVRVFLDWDFEIFLRLGEFVESACFARSLAQ